MNVLFSLANLLIGEGAQPLGEETERFKELEKSSPFLWCRVRTARQADIDFIRKSCINHNG